MFCMNLEHGSRDVSFYKNASDIIEILLEVIIKELKENHVSIVTEIQGDSILHVFYHRKFANHCLELEAILGK